MLKGSELEDYKKLHPKLETLNNKIIVFKKASWKDIDYSLQWNKKAMRECIGPCTPFPIPMVLNTLNLFKPKRWLDPTAGWGDRLIGAIQYNIESYVGVDTNWTMYPVYDKILKDLGTQRQQKEYTVLHDRFQDANLGRKKFDLVFTSPPFFTYEIYPGMVQWKTENEYLIEFLWPLLQRSNKVLRKGGHLVLYIGEAKGTTYVDSMKQYIKQNLHSLEYCGAYYYQGRNPRAYYTFKKV